MRPRIAGPYGYDDDNIVFLDADADGDADFLVGSLDGPDRLLVNDGTGRFTVSPLGIARTPGTLWLAVADLDGDAKLDLIDAQGEADRPDLLYLGAGIAPDTVPPVISSVQVVDGSIHARIDDRKSPSVASDWRDVVVLGTGADTPMTWYGEYLWRTPPMDPGSYRVCATDAAGNQACSEPITVEG